jgi:hypothetical protein
MPSNPFDDLRLMIEIADPLDLELRPPAGGNKWSADLMEKKHGRPPVGVQGRILDAMDDERVTRKQASELLDLVQQKIRGECTGLSVVDGDGNLSAITFEADTE